MAVRAVVVTTHLFALLFLCVDAIGLGAVALAQLLHRKEKGKKKEKQAEGERTKTGRDVRRATGAMCNARHGS